MESRGKGGEKGGVMAVDVPSLATFAPMELFSRA